MPFQPTDKQRLIFALGLDTNQIESGSLLSSLMRDLEALDQRNGSTFVETVLAKLTTIDESTVALNLARAEEGVSSVSVSGEIAIQYRDGVSGGTNAGSLSVQIKGDSRAIRRILDPRGQLWSVTPARRVLF